MLDSTRDDALLQFSGQTETLQPGDDGWWKVWGAGVRHIRTGDIVLTKNGDDTEIIHVTGTFTAKAAPVRLGFIDQDDNRFTLGALVPIVLVRRGTLNTLADA